MGMIMDGYQTKLRERQVDTFQSEYPTQMTQEQETRTQHETPDQTHGFPSHLESNPIILRARIAKANDRINSMIDSCAVESGYTKDPGELSFSYREVWDMLREIQTIIGGL